MVEAQCWKCEGPMKFCRAQCGGGGVQYYRFCIACALKQGPAISKRELRRYGVSANRLPWFGNNDPHIPKRAEDGTPMAGPGQKRILREMGFEMFELVGLTAAQAQEWIRAAEHTRAAKKPLPVIQPPPRTREAPDKMPMPKETIEYLRRLPYSLYLQSDHWRQVRNSAMKRANFKCQLCNGGEGLNVHHRTYERKGCERPEDLTVLCRDCHAKFHDKLPTALDGEFNRLCRRDEA